MPEFIELFTASIRNSTHSSASTNSSKSRTNKKLCKGRPKCKNVYFCNTSFFVLTIVLKSSSRGKLTLLWILESRAPSRSIFISMVNQSRIKFHSLQRNFQKDCSTCMVWKSSTKILNPAIFCYLKEKPSKLAIMVLLKYMIKDSTTKFLKQRECKLT